MIRIKPFIALTTLLFLQIDTAGQHVNTWRKGKLTYETKEKVKKNKARDSRSYDADNASVGINMEIVDFKEESPDFLKDLVFACNEICGDMKLKFQSAGEKFLADHESYYSICFGKEPVITAVILREDIKKAYEISIYCYEIQIEEGVEILKSMKFIKE